MELLESLFHWQLIRPLPVVAPGEGGDAALFQRLGGELIFAGDFVQDGESGLDVVAARLSDFAVEEVLAPQFGPPWREGRIGSHDERMGIPLDELAREETHPNRGELRPPAVRNIDEDFLVLGE